MILELDLGNSSAKYRVVDDEKNIKIRGRFDYAELDGFLQKLPENIRRIRAVSVLADAKQNTILQLIEQFLSKKVELAEVCAHACGVTNGYDDPILLGADRWLAIVAAWQQFNCACVVVDAGSALTIDCIDTAGVHLGGYIIPGMRLMSDALISGTEKIRFDKSTIGIETGRNTQQAVGHGGMLAIVAAINLAKSLVEKQLGVAPLVVLAGGDAPQLLPYLSDVVRHQPDLVFEGLAYVLP